jgi:hypothetical protein
MANKHIRLKYRNGADDNYTVIARTGYLEVYDKQYGSFKSDIYLGKANDMQDAMVIIRANARPGHTSIEISDA